MIVLVGFMEHAPGQGEKSCRKTERSEDQERDWFANLLWQAFPEARSEHELAALAAEVLTTQGREIHPRTVRNWLRRENTPHFRYVILVLTLAGSERVFDLFDSGS